MVRSSPGASVSRWRISAAPVSYTHLIGGALDKLLHDAGAEYLDCYNAGIPAAVWAAAGLTERREDDGVIIPNYLTPPLRQNTEYYYFTNQPDGFVLFKADGDQDRPNLPCEDVYKRQHTHW